MCAVRRAQASKGLKKRPVKFKPYYNILLSENLGMHCREWPARKANAEVQMLFEGNSKPHDIVIYTDGSVTRDRSGWGFTVKQDERTAQDDSGAHRVTTSSLTLEVEVVTHAIQWLTSKRDTVYTCYHSHRLAHSHAQSSPTKTSVYLLFWARRSQWEWPGR